MAASWILAKAFLREATEDAQFRPVGSFDTVYAKLRALQRGAYNVGTGEGGLIQVSSKIGETEFSFTLPEGMSPSDIMETAELALERIAGCTTVDQVRGLLTRTKRKGSDFRRLLCP